MCLRIRRVGRFSTTSVREVSTRSDLNNLGIILAVLVVPKLVEQSLLWACIRTGMSGP